MKKQNITFLALLVITQTTLAQVTIAHASETADTKNTTELMNTAHASAHLSETKDQPFWTKDQSKQAKLETKYQNEIAENPDNKQSYTYLAGLYLTNNKTSKAIDAYQDAITHNPENPKLFAAISIAYLHQSKFAMARAMADEALRLDPSLIQVEKINEYIIAKQEAIKAAAMVPVENTASSGGSLGPAPIDAMHGAKNNTLQVNDPQSWTETH